MRVKAVIAYDGSRFFGFQYQKNRPTIMQEIYKALDKLGIKSQVVGSGRTDRGVHATSQVIHFDIPSFWSNKTKLLTYLNRHLYPDIYVRRLEFVDSAFHARFSAKRRAYRYILTKKPFNPFEARYKLFRNFNEKAILKAVKLFEGKYDFKYFMKTGSDTKSSVRTIYKAKAYNYKEHFILYFEADGFLRAQVRMMVEFLLKISDGELTIYHLQEQLAAKKRHITSLAPPNGLYLAKVIY